MGNRLKKVPHHEKIINEIGIKYASMSEQVLETFEELSKQNPEKAIGEFSKYLDKALSSNNDFFKGYMCGGPYPGATAPFLNVLGSIYPSLRSYEVREMALNKALNFLDGLNYLNSQENIEHVQEPWFARDILMNRSLYWPGFAEYKNKLKEVKTVEDFQKEFIKEGKGADYLNVRSAFWLAYAVSRKDVSAKARNYYSTLFPEIVDRTKDMIAGYHYIISKHNNQSIDEALAKVCDEWKEDIKEKTKKEEWLLLPETKRRLNLS